MKLDATILSAVCELAERAINKALKHDPGTRAGLETLKGKVFCLDIYDINTTIYLRLSDDPAAQTKVSVMSLFEDQVDCKLSGKANDIAKLIFSDNQQNLLDSGVTVTGDVGLLMALTKISHKLDIDWEEALNDITGDVAGHQLAQVIRSIYQRFAIVGQRAPFFISDYLTEELRAVPSEPELRHFYQNVNQVRAHTERLEQRLDRFLQSTRSSNG